MHRFTFAQSLSLFPLLITLSHSLPSTPARIPNGQNPALPCMQLGHTDCIAGGPRNQFGLDFAANGGVWNENLCMMDSDNDGITNGAELGDPCCTWREGDGDEGLRTDNISNPGDPESTEAAGQPGCLDGGVLTGAPADPLMAANPNATMVPMVTDVPGRELPKLATASPVPTGVYENPGKGDEPIGGLPVSTAENTSSGAPYVSEAPYMSETPYASETPYMSSVTPVYSSGNPDPLVTEEVIPAMLETPNPSATPSPSDEDAAFPGSGLVDEDEDEASLETPAVADASVTPTANVSEAPTQSTNPLSIADLAACFPAEAKVTLKDGSFVSMKHLKVGDEVLAEMPDTYSPVYMFSHREAEGLHDFIRIKTSKGLSITASPGHYIVVDGSLKAAAAVVAGNKVSTKEGEAEVVGIEAVKMTGLYNPHTLAGSIVVDGVLSSDVTTAVKPSLARALLAPFKFMYTVFQRDVSRGFLHQGWSTLAKLAPAGAKEL